MSVSKIKYVKSYVDLLNESYPSKIEKNVFTHKKMKLYDIFSAYLVDNKWIIVCVDYWIWIDENFNELKDNLMLISEEDGVDIEFKNSYIVTQIMQRKKCIEDLKTIFIGRLKSTELS